MMPVNVRGNHWICAIFERGRTKNTHGWFDPLDACATHEDILKVASDLLCHSDGGSKPASSLQYYRGPMQANGTDCGFCVIGFILGEFGRLVMVEPRSDALKHLLPTKISPALDSNHLSRSLECASQVQNFPLQLQQKRIRDEISSMIYTECIESTEMYSMVSALVEPQLPEENPATPYLNNIDRYCQLLEAGQWGDSPEFVAMSKWLHCPVVVVEFPSGNKGVSRTHIFGEDEPGIEVFFLRLNGNHYAVLVPVSDRYELFAEKARSEVYVEPIQKAFIIRGVSVLMLVFGTPMDGNCFFHGAALIEVCVAYAKLVRPPMLHFSRYVKLSKEQRQTVSAANKQLDRCAKVQRQLASTEGGQHSFDELTTGSVLKRHVARDYFGVGPQEGSVIMDPGIGTGTELFHANLNKTNAWIAIGFEENLHLSHGADRTHLNLLRENWRGMMAHAHINSNDVSSFVGVTNVTSYDGAPWSVTTPIDTPHLQLILMFMETDTIDEFTSTKLTWNGLLAYAAAEPRIASQQDKFFSVTLLNGYGRQNRFLSTMFVRSKQFRLPRVDPSLISTGLEAKLIEAARCQEFPPGTQSFVTLIEGYDCVPFKFLLYKILLNGKVRHLRRNILFSPGDEVTDNDGRAGVMIGHTTHPNTYERMLVLSSLPYRVADCEPDHAPVSWFSLVDTSYPCNRELPIDNEICTTAAALLNADPPTKRSLRLSTKVKEQQKCVEARSQAATAEYNSLLAEVGRLRSGLNHAQSETN